MINFLKKKNFILDLVKTAKIKSILTSSNFISHLINPNENPKTSINDQPIPKNIKDIPQWLKNNLESRFPLNNNKTWYMIGAGILMLYFILLINEINRENNKISMQVC